MNTPLWIAILTFILAALAAWAGVRAWGSRVPITLPDSPSGDPALVRSVRMHTTQAPRTGRGPSARPEDAVPIPRLGVVSVFSPKGGSGVSTLAANLAIAVRQQRAVSVALADFDAQSGDAAFLLGLSCPLPPAGVAPQAQPVMADVLAALIEHESGIQVLPQPDRFESAEAGAPGAIGGTLDILASLFDTVIVDTPHLLSDRTLEILERSGDVLMVLEPTVPALRAARRALAAFDRRDVAALTGRVLVVVNRHSDAAQVSLTQIEELLGLPVFATIADDPAAVTQASNLGRPLLGAGAARGAARDIERLARRLVSEL
ncbi:MAG: AAA family ATPase [Candidatus Eiseniibacteriota bacterium]